MRRVTVLALTVGLCASLIAPAFAESKQHQAQAPAKQAKQMEAASAPEFKLIKTLKGEDSYSILRPTFSKSGKYLAANLNETKSICVWDTVTGENIATLKADVLFGEAQLVDGLEFTPDENHLVVFRAGQPLKEINWRKQEIKRSFDLGINTPKIEGYGFTPDYKWLVLATANGIDLIDYEKGAHVSRLLEGEHIHTLDVSRDGKWVAFGKKGNVEHSVGLIDLSSKTVSNYPLSQISEAQRRLLPEFHQVRHVSFEPDAQRLLVGYMALPEGQFKPMGPAGVLQVDLKTGHIYGPKELSGQMLSFDPVALRTPFHSTFINTFEMGAGKTSSAAEFLAPNLSTIKTLTDAELNAPMLTFRVSPDQKWMAGSFKEQDGKVRIRLYELMPQTQSHLN